MTQQTVRVEQGTVTGKLIEHLPHGCAVIERSDGQRVQGEKWEHYLARVNRAR